MHKKISLKVNFTWAFIGNFINAACQWLMLVVLTKTSTVEDVGSFGLAIAISTPIIMLTNLQLRAVYVTDVSEQYKFSEYLGLRLLTMVFAFFLVTTISVFSSYDFNTILLIIVWSMAQGIVSIKDSFLGIMQKYERMDKVSLSRSTQALFSLLFFSLTIFITRNLLLAAIFVLIVRLGVLVFFDLFVGKKMLKIHKEQLRCYKITPQFHLKPIIKLILMTVPLGIVMGLVSLNNHLPRYFIENYHGKATLGYFTAIASFIVAGSLAASALAQSAAPRLAVYYKENIRAFGKLLIKLGLVGVALGLAGIMVAVVFGQTILSVFFTPEYAQFNHILVLLMISALPYYVSSFLYNGLMAARKLKIQVPLSCISILLVFLASWILVPRYGQVGAAWAIFAGSTTTMIGTIIINWNVYKNKLIQLQIK